MLQHTCLQCRAAWKLLDSYHAFLFEEARQADAKKRLAEAGSSCYYKLLLLLPLLLPYEYWWGVLLVCVLNQTRWSRPPRVGRLRKLGCRRPRRQESL